MTGLLLYMTRADGKSLHRPWPDVPKDRPGNYLGHGLLDLGPDHAGAIVSAHGFHPNKRSDVKQLYRRRYINIKGGMRYTICDWRGGKEGREILQNLDIVYY